MEIELRTMALYGQEVEKLAAMAMTAAMIPLGMLVHDLSAKLGMPDWLSSIMVVAAWFALLVYMGMQRVRYQEEIREIRDAVEKAYERGEREHEKGSKEWSKKWNETMQSIAKRQGAANEQEAANTTRPRHPWAELEIAEEKP